MNICITLNEKYFKYMYVMLESLFSTNVGVHKIYVLYYQVPSEYIGEATRYINNHGSDVIWIQEDIAKYRKFPMKGNWSYETYFILRIPELLPDCMDRVLYLDIDLVVNQKLDGLYNLDFEGNYIAARKVILDEGDALVAYFPGKTFLNSGVVLMNLELLRKNISFEMYEKAAEEMNYEFYMDEGLISFIMYGKVIFIENKYNYWLGIGEEEEPAIIHYICPEHPYKPWDLYFDEDEIENYGLDAPKFYINREINRLFAIWWRYAEKTPCYDVLKFEANSKKEWFKRALYQYLKKMMK